MKLSFLTNLTATSLLAGMAFAWAITPSAAQLIPSRAAIVDGQATQIVEQAQARRQARAAVRQYRSGGRSAMRQFRSGRRAAVRQFRREARPLVRQERRIDRRLALRGDRRFDRRFHRRHDRRHHFRRFHDDDFFFSFGLAAPFVAAPYFVDPYVAAPVAGGCGPAVVVEPGDTLALIAARCGTTVGALMAANPQIHNPNIIRVGEVINIA